MSRKVLPFTVRAALAAWLTPHRSAIENPTPSNYKTLIAYAEEATKALTYPIDYGHIQSLIRTLGWALPTNLRRSLAAKNNPNIDKFAQSGQPTIKHATLCAQVRNLEARVAFLESQLGVSTAAH